MFWYIVAVIFCYILLVRCFNCCHIRYLIQCDMLVSPCAVLVEGFLLLQLHTRVVSSFFFYFIFLFFIIWVSLTILLLWKRLGRVESLPALCSMHRERDCGERSHKRGGFLLCNSISLVSNLFSFSEKLRMI